MKPAAQHSASWHGPSHYPDFDSVVLIELETVQ